MIISRDQMNFIIFSFKLCAIALSLTHCDARRSRHALKGDNNQNKIIKKLTRPLQVSKHLDINYAQLDDDVPSSIGSYGVNSPFTLPPYDSLPPVSWPDQNTPPFCLNPPFTPQPPSTTIPLPPPAGDGSGGDGYIPLPNPPQGPSGSDTNPSPSNPNTGLSPPESNPLPNPPTFNPSPTEPIINPPYSYEPSPPSTTTPSPPSNNPSSPSIFVPSPPVFQPPVVYPPPAVPPPPKAAHGGATWCVAKPTVPDPIIQEAMNYACGSGGDCGSIQPDGLCFHPDTLYAHASFAFNSYWQRTKVAGGTCDFGGTAILVTVDPSYDGCHFVLF